VLSERVASGLREGGAQTGSLEASGKVGKGRTHMIARTIEHTMLRSSSSSTTRFCDARGCTQTTREGKPFCPDHVELHPYVQTIIGTLREREAEEEKVRQRGARAVDPGGLTAKELVLHLSLHGARTIERLSRELQLDTKVLDGYVGALVRRGVVALGRTNRGSTVVRLSSELAS